MAITDPQSLLNSIDQDCLKKYLGFNPFMEDVGASIGSIEYVEPYGKDAVPEAAAESKETSSPVAETTETAEAAAADRRIEGKVLKLGDFIDTDAVSFSLALNVELPL
jgi:hypothetical protein